MKKLAVNVLLFLSVTFSCFAWSEQVELNNASLRDFVAWYSKEAAQAIVITPDVKGEITVYSADVTKENITDFFVSVLRANGYDFFPGEPAIVGKYQPVPEQVESEGFYREAFPVLSGGADAAVDLVTRTYKINHVRAKDLAPVIDIYLKSGRVAGVKAFPFDGANILVVTAPETQHEQLKTVLPDIDVPRDQVLIEGLMFETTEGKAFDFSFSAGSQTGTVAGGVNTDRLASVLAAAGGSFGVFNGNVLGLSLKAVQKDSSSSVLSVPRILTMSGQRGYISVGQNVPFVTGKVTGEAASVNNPFQTIERHNVGVSLAVTPIVTASDRVIMNINVSADSISSLTGASDIITNQRQIETTVHLESGQTLLLGGLIDDRASNEDSFVPFMSRIPLIGWLFSSESDDSQKRALYVMIHARVLRSL
ncbi:general secretion pathway protein GspD [Xenorhabdus sp. SF857]|uniref:secretin N-terminal domain-containing protein n=1 Tax=Xenorhabdus bakwenae TaxID=3026967 RepID=UPI002557CB36|nr:secretin N-terminal domain-containing protein [Xenorhabdus sp. SF857]WFQ80611.1 general secretion pathway protein GspD [Xenorhabdus sp. SF857]WFQ80622.1 general secretion pathway protein GspD [Xenorhabdus sp. SF857]